MEQRIDVHDTAFMTSAFRAANVALSQDPYAHLWLNENAKRWSQEYLEKVSTEEGAAHCMRNRYFLEQISALYMSGKIEVLINFGSGFSMYPYLLAESLTHIEIDKEEVMHYKKERCREWQSKGNLPHRNVHYISVDFTTDYQENLRSQLRELIAGRPSFILLEGVLFFLEQNDADALFDFFASIQEGSGYVGSASFRPALTKSLAWNRLMTYVAATTTATEETFCLTLEDDYYRMRAGYDLCEVQDFFKLSAQYGYSPLLEADAILNECFYLLKRDS